MRALQELGWRRGPCFSSGSGEAIVICAVSKRHPTFPEKAATVERRVAAVTLGTDGQRISVSRDSIRLPITAGLRDPAVLFPASLVPRLTEQDARNVWLHETAHVRRRDDWTNLIQRIVEAVLFFHPVVLWVGRKLNLERELACDDWVVRRTGNREATRRF